MLSRGLLGVLAPTHQNLSRSSHLALSGDMTERTAICMVTKGTDFVLLNLRLSLNCGYVRVDRTEAEKNHWSPEIDNLTLLLEIQAHALRL